MDDDRTASDEGGWDWYRSQVDRDVRRARSGARLLQQLAIYLGVLEAIVAVAISLGAWAVDDESTGLTMILGVAISLPLAVILPAALWGFGALLDVNASRLDLAILEAKLEDELAE